MNTKFLKFRNKEWVNPRFIYSVMFWDDGDDKVPAKEFYVEIKAASGEKDYRFKSAQERDNFVIQSGLVEYLR